MQIFVENLQKIVSVSNQSVQEVVEHTLLCMQVTCDEVFIYFVDAPTICKLHEEHFSDPSPTDCISIQIDPPNTRDCLLGEIFISPQAAIDYCREKPSQLYEELTLYLVHGLLHLIGYDDIKEKDRTKMRLAEKKVMNYLKEINKEITED